MAIDIEAARQAFRARQAKNFKQREASQRSSPTSRPGGCSGDYCQVSGC